jgi:hypothetical protein
LTQIEAKKRKCAEAEVDEGDEAAVQQMLQCELEGGSDGSGRSQEEVEKACKAKLTSGKKGCAGKSKFMGKMKGAIKEKLAGVKGLFTKDGPGKDGLKKIMAGVKDMAGQLTKGGGFGDKLKAWKSKKGGDTFED